jgi:predicted dehydrogenase
MSRPSRRSFLKQSAAATGIGFGFGFAIGGTKSSGRVIGANDTVRVAIAGLNGRGGAHVDELAGMQGVQVVALVDPDTKTYPMRIKHVELKGHNTPAVVRDVRQVLDDKNIDVLTIAAPNHWHALMTIWACQAGKDVYVEKPCSHNIHEGRVAVDTARKYNRVVQHGTQGRSEKRWAQVAEVARTGKLGKLLISRGLCYKRRESIGTKPDGAAPENLDFDLWLGPAPDVAFNPNYVHYNWHWFWPFGNGDIGNQGVHQMDVARWMIPGATLPSAVVSWGGRFGYQDQGETPNTEITVMPFGETMLVFEVRGLETDGFKGEKVGNILHFEAGIVTNRAYFPVDSDKPAPLPEVEVAVRPGRGHFENFIEAVRSRKTNDLNAEILEGHYSSALCHLANISYRLGADATHKEASATADKDPFTEAVGRALEHLQANGVVLAGLEARFGHYLNFDADSEQFIGHDADQANPLLTREYRAPFVLPGQRG